MPRPYYFFWQDLIKDCYWCFIPLSCRECAFLEHCRKGFFGGRKCYNGCIKLNRKREWEREQDREAYWKALLQDADEADRKGKKRF